MACVIGRNAAVVAVSAVVLLAHWAPRALGETVSIPMCALAPIDPAYTYFRNAAVLRGNTALQGVSFLAPLNIPDGALISQVRVLIDDNAAQNVVIRLWATGSFTTTLITSATSSGTPGTMTLAANASHAVNNTAFAYSVEVAWTTPSVVDQIRIGPVRVTYSQAAACYGDVNDDRIVNGSDLSVLLANFGDVCGP